MFAPILRAFRKVRARFGPSPPPPPPPPQAHSVTTTIHQLPTEIVQHILANLPVAPDLLHHRTVCPLWNDVIESICSQQRSLRLDLFFVDNPSVIEEQFLYQINLAEFVRIQVKDNPLPPLPMVFAFLRRLFPRLEHFIFSIGFTDYNSVLAVMQQLERLWPNAQTLMLSGALFPFSGEVELYCLWYISQMTHLKRLVLKNVFRYYPPYEYIQHLEYFSFTNIFDIGNTIESGHSLAANWTGLNLCINGRDDIFGMALFRSILLMDANSVQPKVFAHITHLGLGYITEENASLTTALVRQSFPSVEGLRLCFRRPSLLNESSFNDLAQLSALSKLYLLNVEISEDFSASFEGEPITMPGVRVLRLTNVRVRLATRAGVFAKLFATTTSPTTVLSRAMALVFPEVEEVNLKFDGLTSYETKKKFNQTLSTCFNNKQMFPRLKKYRDLTYRIRK